MEILKQDEEKYVSDWQKYGQMFEENGRGHFELNEELMFPCLTDYRDSAGLMDFHYYTMDILVSSLIIKSGVKEHIDVGSRIDGLVSHLLAAGISVTEMDIRPLNQYDPGCGVTKLTFVQGDATNLNNIESDSILSLSSLHAIEHFGLGRYGDDINPNACFDAMEALQRVLKPGGKLYLAVPISAEERVHFNAHRIFSPTTIVTSMDKLKLLDVFYLSNMKLSHFAPDEYENGINNLGAYDCGIFVFTK